MCTAQSSRSGGFTIAELLTAVAVATLVLPAVLVIVPRAFDALARSRADAASTLALAEFDAGFSRDFASLVQECGFFGDGSGCSFWTQVPVSAEESAPSLVEYRRERGGVLRREYPLPLYSALAGTNSVSALPPDFSGAPPSDRPSERFFAVTAAPPRYGAAENPGEPGLDLWHCATNAPVSVLATLRARSTGAADRLYFRRTPQ